MPKLNCDLVSISKLQLNCAVFDDFFVIQDDISRTLVGAGEHRKGVYHHY